MSMHDDIKTVLVTEEELKAKVRSWAHRSAGIMRAKTLFWCPSSRARWSLWPT